MYRNEKPLWLIKDCIILILVRLTVGVYENRLLQYIVVCKLYIEFNRHM